MQQAKADLQKHKLQVGFGFIGSRVYALIYRYANAATCRLTWSMRCSISSLA
jgi:hypothetical protein